ncbi:ATP-binding protein [bacterium]|nr:ATP-binding protein [bacterium]
MDSKIEVRPEGLYASAKLCSSCFKTCRECDGAGYIFKQDDRGREHATPCDCQGLQMRVTLFNNARIPNQFYDATFDNFVVKNNPSMEDALKTASFLYKNYKKGNRKGLLFMGGVGVGKTRLVSCILREFTLNHGVPGVFKEFSSLLSEIKSGYDKGMSEAIILEKINEVEILVIDELGKGRKTDWEVNILDAIVSNRYNMRKTTIFTSNYTDSKSTTYREPDTYKPGGEKTEKKETLEQRVYGRIYSRLKGMCDFIEMKGQDFRHPNTSFSYQ